MSFKYDCLKVTLAICFWNNYTVFSKGFPGKTRARLKVHAMFIWFSEHHMNYLISEVATEMFY